MFFGFTNMVSNSKGNQCVMMHPLSWFIHGLFSLCFVACPRLGLQQSKLVGLDIL